MKIHKLQQGEGRKLYLILNGWSVAPELFEALSLPVGADVWVGYDYRSLTFPDRFDRFEEVHLIAWSLGVWVATALWGKASTFASTMAINGTPFPIHAEWGIPPAIFEGTLAHLDTEGLRRFDRRMCGDRATLQRYQQLTPIPEADKAEELRALYQMIDASEIDQQEAAAFWNRAIISTADRIFPTANQQAYWEGKAEIVSIEASHLPFYQPELSESLWK